MIYLDPKLRAALGTVADPFAAVMALSGDLIRAREGRRTLRLSLAGASYFLKAHAGVGWREIFKNLAQGRLPVISARNEWRAIQHLTTLGIATTPLVGYGVRGRNPARLQSFVLTEALGDTVTLEMFCQTWQQVPPRTPTALRLKRALLTRVADIARQLHSSGMNHRDFYLCHFRLALPPVTKVPCLYLMDLHRAQLRRRIPPRRWRVKDLGSLYFSAMDIGLTRRDLLRFIKTYRQQPLRQVLPRERRFWQAVQRRALRLYRAHHNGRVPG